MKNLNYLATREYIIRVCAGSFYRSNQLTCKELAEIMSKHGINFDVNVKAKLRRAGVLNCTCRGRSAMWELATTPDDLCAHVTQYAIKMGECSYQMEAQEKRRAATVYDYKREIKKLRKENEQLKKALQRRGSRLGS